MQRFTLAACSRCRLLLSHSTRPESWFHDSQYLARRFRSNKTKFAKRPKHGFDGAFANGGYVNPTHRPPKKKPKPPANFRKFAVDELPEYLALRVVDWAKAPKVHRRLQTFGIPEEDVPILLREFAQEVSGGLLARPGVREKYTLDRFLDSSYTDPALTNIFYTWASDPNNQLFLETIVPPSTMRNIIRLYTAADQSYPADQYPEARSMKRRIIMHVGPTNSGKTHMALRALAAARSGVYAGPLRLLAHEVWERLNKGQIVPLGADPDAEEDPREETTVDTMEPGSSGSSIGQKVCKKYARECNLSTGEETKVVSEHATLLSCTVEMLTTGRMYDVAVVDEIQMISDIERGGGWTRAVLGIPSPEIHLCGEATAIPLIKTLLKDTGDELVINRYERLTPLVVQEQSLGGDLSRVEKGDCIITFSRTGIFALKQQVEELTGLRCAVVYGRLPPETRSEQASLFNDPGSGYDVMIGSDAIGMGLNL
jgi:ATP-dependent RNA helicase SUPV3L1/SUV3